MLCQAFENVCTHKQSDRGCFPTGQQHGNMFEVQQQPHWQQQQDEAITPAAPSRVPTLQAPSAPQLQRPAYYPDPEPGLCCIFLAAFKLGPC